MTNEQIVNKLKDIRDLLAELLDEAAYDEVIELIKLLENKEET